MWLIRYILPGAGDTTEGTEEVSFTAPAKGDAFDFDVVVHLFWSAGARGGGPDAAERDCVRSRVRAEARAVARKHSPYRPQDAERELNNALDELLARLPASDRRVILRWTARAEVRCCEEVRHLQQERARRLYAIDSQAAVAKRHAEATEEMLAAWERFLGEARKSRLTRYALRLAEHPENAADIITKMLDDNEDTAAHFLAKLDKLVSSHQQGNIYEFLIESESALRHAMIALGLPVPPLAADPLLTTGSGQA